MSGFKDPELQRPIELACLNDKACVPITERCLSFPFFWQSFGHCLNLQSFEVKAEPYNATVCIKS
jgi:hypothetical protein